MVFNFKQFMFDKSLVQNDLAQILGASQSAISDFVNGKRLPMDRHIEALAKEFGEDVISQYMVDEDKYREFIGTRIPATIIPAEIVEEIKEEAKEEVAEAESIPIIREDIATVADINIREYIEENGDELERINPSQLLSQADLAEKVMRTSMLPTFAPGDIIFIRFMKDKTKLVDGETYYFDLKSFPTMIRKVKIEGDKLHLIAQNPNFGDIVITKSDVVNAAKIVGLLRMTFTDFYSDIEEARKQKEKQISSLIDTHSSQVHSLINEIKEFGKRENRLIDMLEKKL